MIVIDRDLTDAEVMDLADRPVIDLREALPASDAGGQRAALFDWLDHIPDPGPDDSGYPALFRVGERRYWLHVRARLFYAVYADAQLLDRLPGLADLDAIEIVYARAESSGFWRRWAPGARQILGGQPAPSGGERSPLRVSLADVATFIRRIPAALASVRGAIDTRPDGVLFSVSGSLLDRPDGLYDRQLGPLLDAGPGSWLRIEFVPPPSRELELRRDSRRQGPRAHRTIFTTAILTAYLLRHPWQMAAIVRDHVSVRRRLRRPIRHSWTFPFGDRIWKARIEGTARRIGPSIVLLDAHRKAFEWFLRRARPGFALASGENNAPGRTFLQAARKLAIPTFGVQHGTIQPHNVDYRFPAGQAGGPAADYFLAWGEQSRELLIDRSSYRPDRVLVVGQLFSDTLAEPEPDPGLREFRRKQARPLVFFASQHQPQVNLNRTLAASHLAAFCRENDFCCAVKLHPAETDDGVHRRCFSREGIEDRLVIVDGDVYAMIAASDYGATCYSTVAWEMMAMGTPVIIFDPLHIDWLRLRGARSVYHVEGAERPFEEWRRDQSRHVEENRALATWVLGPRDGRVAQRIRDIIDRVGSRDGNRRGEEDGGTDGNRGDRVQPQG